MTDERDDLAAIDDAAKSLVPELTRRLREHGLGEIEVRRGSLRVVMRATASATDAKPADTRSDGDTTASAGATSPPPTGAAAQAPDRPPRQQVVSPAVGIFIYADGLGTGLAVKPGQTIGRVDMLGVHYDVRAHRAGSVASLVTESGEPVEFGQVLVEIEEAAAP